MKFQTLIRWAFDSLPILEAMHGEREKTKKGNSLASSFLKNHSEAAPNT
jgi:hypothetical protein